MATVIRDYQHAKKVFLSGNFDLMPKQKFLYYVCLNTTGGASLFGGGESASSQTLVEQYETGILAKRVQLPKFSLGNKVMNNYNRKEIVHTNITYDPITITFHDDSSDLVLKFWNDYYTHYYRDSDYESNAFLTNDKFSQRGIKKWGFGPRNGTDQPYLRDIQIYSFHNKRFTEYKLINPHITGWQHGDHDALGSTELMEHQMTVAYETVKYKTGSINAVDVNGFATIRYDNTESPLGADDITLGSFLQDLSRPTRDLSRPDGAASGGGFIDTVSNAVKLFNTVKDANLGAIGKLVVADMSVNALNKVLNQATSTGSAFPGLGSLGGAVAGISGSLNQLGGAVGQISTGLSSGNFAGVGGALNQVGGAINGAAGDLGGSLSKAVGGATDLLKGGARAITGALGGASFVSTGLNANPLSFAENLQDNTDFFTSSNFLYGSDSDLSYSGDDPLVIERMNAARSGKGLPPLSQTPTPNVEE